MPYDRAAAVTDGQQNRECKITFVKDDTLPQGAQHIGDIESDINRNLFITGIADIEGDLRPELIEKACGINATHVIIDDVIETKAVEFSHLHAWARAFRVEK